MTIIITEQLIELQRYVSAKNWWEFKTG